jgi:predicted amidohydrolase
MKVACIQNGIKTGDVNENLKTFTNDLQFCNENNVDIIVFPEMFATGFDYENLLEHSKKTDSIIEDISSKLNDGALAILCLPENENNSVFNTIFAVTKEGIQIKYRKIFLFSPLKEDAYFSKGDFNIPILDFKGFKVSLHTCYEIRFPELFRVAAYNGSNIMIIPAIWPEFKKYHWLTLLRARAIENQSYVIGCNAYEVKTPKKTLLCGHSAIFDPWGEAVGYIENTSKVLISEISMDKIEDVKNKVPSLCDAKAFFTITKK